MVRKPALVGAAICFVSAGVLEPDGSPLKIAAGALFWVLAIWGVLPVVRGWFVPRARPPVGEPRRRRAGGRQATAPTTTRARCTWHQNKAIFATEREAQDFVEWTRRRYAAGRWSGKPMDHAYRCPVLPSRHWHVSSKPQRPW